MPDFITMQQRIADEMARDDLGEHVRQAIYDACNRFKNELFFINRGLFTTNTTVGQQVMAQPFDAVAFDAIFLTAHGYRRPLSETTIEQLLGFDDLLLSNRGVPTQYALFNAQLYLYPIPDKVYPITFLYRKWVPFPVNDGDGDETSDASFFWMTTAERMIRCYAKGILYRDVLKDEDSAKLEFDSAEREYMVQLQRTGENVIPDHVTPWDWY